MNTTNPGQPPDPSKLTHPEPGAPAADDHGGNGPPDASVIKRGYEADGYDTKSVLSVPLLVIGFFVLAFGTVTIMFGYFRRSEPEPTTSPQAADRNAAPLNERMARISRGSPDVDQPRLEPLKLREGASRSITRPETLTGNSPEYRPEDIRVSEKNTPTLYSAGWVEKDKFAHIPINAAMDLALKGGDIFKAAAVSTLPTASTHLPTAANAGRGAEKCAVTVPGEKPKSEMKDANKKGDH